jgi:hypothetical protein
MAKNQSDARDPMTREVDRLLAQLDRKHSASSPTRNPPAPAEVRPAAAPPTIVWASSLGPTTSLAPAPAFRVESATYQQAALWGRVLLGASLALIMTDWSYAHSCGWPLLGYGLAVATLLITGAWVALVAWKQRSGLAHILALILFYWGLVLAAEQLLPRIGYAWNSASWHCSVSQPR